MVKYIEYRMILLELGLKICRTLYVWDNEKEMYYIHHLDNGVNIFFETKRDLEAQYEFDRSLEGKLGFKWVAKEYKTICEWVKDFLQAIEDERNSMDKSRAETDRIEKLRLGGRWLGG